MIILHKSKIHGKHMTWRNTLAPLQGRRVLIIIIIIIIIIIFYREYLFLI